jgi:hypothetical protein
LEITRRRHHLASAEKPFEILVDPSSKISLQTNDPDAYLPEVCRVLCEAFGERQVPLFDTAVPEAIRNLVHCAQPVRICTDFQKKLLFFTADEKAHAKFMNEHAPSVAEMAEFMALKSPA